MAVNQARSNRKSSGGRYKKLKVRRLHQLGRLPAHTKIDEQDKRKNVRTRGGDYKTVLLTANKVNLYDPQKKKFSVCKLLSVSENPANSQFVRRNIITKGAIVQTELGKAKITSRPGQHGVVNAILV